MANANATIAAGAAVSGVVAIAGQRVAAIQMPAVWTTANLTFQGSFDGGTFADIYDEAGTEFSITAAASRYIGLDAGALELSGLQWLKVRSGTVASPVNQVAAAIIQLVLA